MAPRSGPLCRARGHQGLAEAVGDAAGRVVRALARGLDLREERQRLVPDLFEGPDGVVADDQVRVVELPAEHIERLLPMIPRDERPGRGNPDGRGRILETARERRTGFGGAAL